MRSSLSLLAALVVMSSVALAQPGRRPAARRADAGVTADAAAPVESVPTPADAGAAGDAGSAAASPTCCCRAWSHGWQYAWRSERECAAMSGSCVSPDHC